MTTSRLTPRGGTIFWGTVLLLVATITGIAVGVGAWNWTTTLWVIVVFGGLMVIAGLIGGVARALTRASTDRLTSDSTDAPLP